MDFAALLNEYFVVTVVLACLIVGYCIKHLSFLKWIPNNDIPIILAVVGAVLNAIVSKPSIDTAVFGAFMGLSSTGLHQTFKKFVENKNVEEVPTENKTE